MTTFLRGNLAQGEAMMVKQNLSLMSALPGPILIIDPLQISLEYIELLHADDKVTLLHIGDPTFKSQFVVEAKESNVIIVNHATLDLKTFVAHIDLPKIKLANKDLVVYHVAPSLIVAELIYVPPSQVISFDLHRSDISKYVHNRLQLLIPDKARYCRNI